MRHDKTNGWTRRDFLAASAAGVTVAMAPAFLVSCGGPLAPPPVAAPGGTGGAGVDYFSTFGVDDQVLGRVLQTAMGRGGDYADLYFQHGITNYLGLEDGEVNRAYSDVMLGCGVRVVKGDQTGFAFTEDLTIEALTAAATTAAVVAEGAAASALRTITRVDTPAHYPVEIPWAGIGADRKMPFLTAAEGAARGVDARIVKVRVFMADSTERILIATSDGRKLEDCRPMTTSFVTCVAQDKDRREENYHSFGLRKGFEHYTEERVVELARTAARRTVVLFDAVPPPAGDLPVVLAAGESGILLHEAMGHGFEADFNRKGISVYSDRIGKKVAPEAVTIVDDATNPSERGSLNIDDEGTVGQRTVLVEDGVLRSYLHDRISAAHYGVSPTGNGRRESYQYPPVPRMRNTYMLDGPNDPAEIIASVKKGIYAETFTNGQVQIGSGDFSFYLKGGYLIENGRLTRPVKDANLIGFGPKVLENVEMVGNDSSLFSGAGSCGKDGQRVPVGMGLPTVKCTGISVGGVNNG